MYKDASFITVIWIDNDFERKVSYFKSNWYKQIWDIIFGEIKKDLHWRPVYVISMGMYLNLQHD